MLLCRLYPEDKGGVFMGKIIGAYLLPHPPIILKEVGKGEEKKVQKTIEGMKKTSIDIKDKKPGVIILITPHGTIFQDAVAILARENLKGDMSMFRAKEVQFVKKNHLGLIKEIINYSGKQQIYCALINDKLEKKYNVSGDLDHGAMVPLYFIDKEYTDYKLVHITYGLLPREDLYRFGMVIQKAVEKIEEDAVVIASGDLSHRLTKDAPAGYSPKGKEFDKQLMELLEKGKIEEIFSLPSDLCEEAGECGLRSIDVMLGSCDGYETKPEILSYEGPFGVGYGVVKIDVGSKDESKKLISILQKNQMNNMNNIRSNEDEYVKYARKALETYVKYGKEIEVSEDISQEMKEKRAGVFVSLKKAGELRGCIGTIQPITENIAKEIIRNAISAGTNDPRFYPIEEEELDQLVYSVDVLQEPEPIKSLDELDVKKYGVIVQSGRKTGLLLPNLENVNTVEEQVRIALQKAGIHPDEEYSLKRFEVIRHS